MPVMPSGIVKQHEIAAAILKTAQALKPDVIHMRYELSSDSSGAEAIFFRIILSDSASKPARLYSTTERIIETILENVQPREKFGLEAYFNFRSESEQAKLQDPMWG